MVGPRESFSRELLPCSSLVGRFLFLSVLYEDDCYCRRRQVKVEQGWVRLVLGLGGRQLMFPPTHTPVRTGAPREFLLDPVKGAWARRSSGGWLAVRRRDNNNRRVSGGAGHSEIQRLGLVHAGALSHPCLNLLILCLASRQRSRDTFFFLFFSYNCDYNY